MVHIFIWKYTVFQYLVTGIIKENNLTLFCNLQLKRICFIFCVFHFDVTKLISLISLRYIRHNTLIYYCEIIQCKLINSILWLQLIVFSFDTATADVSIYVYTYRVSTRTSHTRAKLRVACWLPPKQIDRY